jgi:hypothetical protein
MRRCRAKPAPMPPSEAMRAAFAVVERMGGTEPTPARMLH